MTNKKIIYVLFYVLNFCSFTDAMDSKWRITESECTDIRAYKYTEGLFVTDIAEFGIENNVFGEKEFDSMFGKHTNQELSHGMHCGQIRVNNSSNSCIGTGTIIKVEKNNDIFEVTGISALHVFVDEKKDNITGGKKYFVTKNRLFYQDTKDSGKGITSLTKFKIKDVFIQEHISKDICIFKGSYTKEVENKDDFLNFVTLSLPSIISEEESKSLFDKKLESCFMIHHPFGVKEQRINDGHINFPSNNNLEGNHWIRSLGGSSGASIIYKDISKIVSIHTSGDTAFDQGKPLSITYKEGTEEDNCNLVNNNIFIPITNEDFLSIVNSEKSLYKVPKDFLNSTISKFIESKNYKQKF